MAWLGGGDATNSAVATGVSSCKSVAYRRLLISTGLLKLLLDPRRRASLLKTANAPWEPKGTKFGPLSSKKSELASNRGLVQVLPS